MSAPPDSKSVELTDTVRLNLVYCDAYRPSVTLTSRDFAQGRLEGFVRELALFPSPSSDQLHQPTKVIYVHDGSDDFRCVSIQNISSETPDPGVFLI
jgi:hypothetical protein